MGPVQQHGDGFLLRRIGECAPQRPAPHLPHRQGSQLTSGEFTGILADYGIQISKDERCRALDSVFTERLWRSGKCEPVCLLDYKDRHALHRGRARHFRFYNHERPHSGPKNHRHLEAGPWRGDRRSGPPPPSSS